MGIRPESMLMESLIIECMQIYGFETYYLPRAEVNPDLILTEDPLSKFLNSFMIEMYMTNVEGFEGERDLMTKFGVEIKDTAKFIVSRRRWAELVGRASSHVLSDRPYEGDVIFFPLTKSFFEIKRVETLDPFFQVGKLYTFVLDCELMNYSSERFETGIEEIDDIAISKTLDVLTFGVALEDGLGAIMLESDVKSSLILEEYNIEQNDPQAQNETFEKDITEILDFSENNPFGEIR